MSARDFYHDVVIDALIDLGAENLLGAEQNGRKIAIEIKSFRNPSALSDFHVALGQYLNYQYTLEIRDILLFQSMLMSVSLLDALPGK